MSLRLQPATRALALLATSALLAQGARAADTAETWDLGATDAEFGVSVDGLAGRRGQGAVAGDVLLGYGVARHLALFLGATLEATDTLQDGQATLRTGVFGTPLDTAHVDIDLFGELGLAGLQQMVLRPALELNLDHRDDRSSVGAYLRAGLPLYGLDVEAAGARPLPVLETGLHAELTIGCYLMVAAGHQLLLEASVVAHPGSDALGPSLQGPDLAVGYNSLVLDNLELLTQATIGRPGADGVLPLGLSVGFIATLPAGT